MQINLDSFDKPRQLRIVAETRNDAYDLGAIRTALATHGAVFEMLPPGLADSVVLALPLSWPSVEHSESAD